METSQLTKQIQSRGFSVLEVLIAITVLAVGVAAMGMLVAQSLVGTDRARDLALATTLTSEKLEDLNRWTAVDPHVAAGGSLSTDTMVGTLNYYDDIDLSNTNGQISETFASGATYSTVIHKATGEVIPTSSTTAPTGTGIVGFHRRWVVEAGPTVNGIALTGSRRVTVKVTLSEQYVDPPVTFQMSVIRP